MTGTGSGESEMRALREAADLVRARGTAVPVAAIVEPHDRGGHPAREAAFPVRVQRLLGTRALVVTGTGIALDPRLSPGDLVLLDDQINLTGDSPLVGPNLDELGPRFPDMSEPFDRGLRDLAERVAHAEGVELHRGVYAGVPAEGFGPGAVASWRTVLRSAGAVVAGPSIVSEVIVARHMSMPVLGIAVVAEPDASPSAAPGPGTSPMESAADASARLMAFVGSVVREL